MMSWHKDLDRGPSSGAHPAVRSTSSLCLCQEAGRGRSEPELGPDISVSVATPLSDAA